MTAPKPQECLDILDIQIGIASQGETSGLAFRLHLRDGQSLLFALTDHQARLLAKGIVDRLDEAAAPLVSVAKH
jgi:hypothetical protein